MRHLKGFRPIREGDHYDVRGAQRFSIGGIQETLDFAASGAASVHNATSSRRFQIMQKYSALFYPVIHTIV